MEAVRLELFRRRLPVYRYAREINISEHRLRRILLGRVVHVTEEEIQRIAFPLGLDPVSLAQSLKAA